MTCVIATILRHPVASNFSRLVSIPPIKVPRVVVTNFSAPLEIEKRYNTGVGFIKRIKVDFYHMTSRLGVSDISDAIRDLKVESYDT